MCRCMAFSSCSFGHRVFTMTDMSKSGTTASRLGTWLRCSSVARTSAGVRRFTLANAISIFFARFSARTRLLTLDMVGPFCNFWALAGRSEKTSFSSETLMRTRFGARVTPAFSSLTAATGCSAQRDLCTLLTFSQCTCFVLLRSFSTPRTGAPDAITGGGGGTPRGMPGGGGGGANPVIGGGGGGGMAEALGSGGGGGGAPHPVGGGGGAGQEVGTRDGGGGGGGGVAGAGALPLITTGAGGGGGGGGAFARCALAFDSPTKAAGCSLLGTNETDDGSLGRGELASSAFAPLLQGLSVDWRGCGLVISSRDGFGRPSGVRLRRRSTSMTSTSSPKSARVCFGDDGSMASSSASRRAASMSGTVSLPFPFGRLLSADDERNMKDVR
eukprot:PhM_4_TR549/c0_g1_i1/m.53182